MAPRLLALLAVACLTAAAPGSGQPRFSGMLFSRVFSDRDTQSTARGNFIAAAPNGDIYFGNEGGLLVYDGSSWRSLVTTTPTRSKIRSMNWSQGELFASSYGSVGRLSSGDDGQLAYAPIDDPRIRLDPSDYFRQIVDNGNFVHFVAPRSVATYDRANDSLSLESFDAWTKAAFARDGRFFLATDAFGLLEFVDGAFVATKGFEHFNRENSIILAAKSPSGTIAFATERGDLYRILDDKAVPGFGGFYNPERGSIRDIAFLDDNRLAVAAAGSGIRIIDAEGELLHRIDRNDDYRWTGASQLVVDQQASLWAMFNSTVGKVLASSPVTQIDERMRPALFYASPYFAEDDVYLRSNGQLFRSKRGEQGLLEGFETVFEDPAIAVSSLAYAPEGLYANINDALHLLRDGKFVELGETGRLDHFEAWRGDPDLIFAIDSAQMLLFRRSGDSIETVFATPHPLGYVYKITQDDEKAFWLELGLGRVCRVAIVNEQITFRIFDQRNGVPDDWVTTWEHEGRMRFPERTGIYAYDAQTDTFRRDDVLHDYFPYGAESFHRLATDPRGNVWASYGRRTYVLWKQPDGSYVKDAKTLAILGELYLNNYLFLDDGQAFLTTASEMIHVDPSAAARPQGSSPPTRIAEVTNLEGDHAWYLDAGIEQPFPSIQLGPNQNSLLVRVANRDSVVLRPPTFQYLLEGAGDSWSKWSASNEIHLSNLRHGDYRLRVRTLLDSGEEAPETELSFVVVPSLYHSRLAYVCYLLLGLGAVLLGYRLFSRNLKATNLKLERMVQERTSEIESQNTELESQAEALERKNLELANQSEQLQQNARELGATLEELRAAQDQLMSTSRRAGMAEVATNVLHNVGNVLNSINVAATSIGQRLRLDRAERLEKLSRLVAEHRADLPRFFSKDPRGAAIPEYLAQLAQVIAEDQAQLSSEFRALQQNVEHVKRIIAFQQAHAKTVDVRQDIDVAELLENAIGIIFSDVERSLYQIDRECEPDLAIESDKHRILQMLTNVIKNAKDAIVDAHREAGRIEISAAKDPESEYVVLSVKDNGVGIAPENLSRIFSHGFTTKDDGHGFGMHSCANAARALGGDIQVESEGEGCGATVRLRLPVRSPAPAEEA